MKLKLDSTCVLVSDMRPFTIDTKDGVGAHSDGNSRNVTADVKFLNWETVLNIH